MTKILKHDTDGTKPLLTKGEFGYDDYTAGGDAGRVYVGTGTSNKALATLEEIGKANDNVNQVAHGFSVLDAVTINGSGDYVAAQADDYNTLAVAIVTEVTDVDNFLVSFNGIITATGHGLTVGSMYYLSDTVAGDVTSTAPSLSQAIFTVIDANTISLTVDNAAHGDTNVAKTDVSADFTAGLQAGGSDVVVDTDIGTTVQAYDADTAKTDVDQDWTGSQRGVVVTANNMSYDLDAGNFFSSTPTTTETLTFTNIPSSPARQSGSIRLDNSGGHVISAAATTLINSGDLTTISTAGIYVLGYESEGTDVSVTVSKALTGGGA